MKAARLNTLLQTIISRTTTNSKNVVSSYFYSTTTTRTRAISTPFKERYTKSQPRDSLVELHRRIKQAIFVKSSVTPVLDKWIEEGGSVTKDDLLDLIRKLRFYRRFANAFPVSMWMSEKRNIELSSGDYAIRLDLTAKVHGIEQAENVFNNIPVRSRGLEVYSALLNSYARAKSVEKAEEVMQKLRDLGLAVTSLNYNVMLNLYNNVGDAEKLGKLISEMEENGIPYDTFTYGTILAAYGAVPDVEGVEKTVLKMESDPNIVLDWNTYGVAANGYTKVGLFDKALEMLKKAEGLVIGKEKHTAYNFLLTQYAAIEKKEEVLRLWDVYEKEKVFNKGYLAMLSSLLKFDDLETAENIFDKWESQASNYDFRIANLFICYYTKKGLIEKAETLLNRAISEGGTPTIWTWIQMVAGYFQSGQTPLAVEMMKLAILQRVPGSKWQPRSEDLVACLRYLGEENPEEAKKFVELLRDKDIISSDGQQRLLHHLKQRNLNAEETCLAIEECLTQMATQDDSSVVADEDDNESKE